MKMNNISFVESFSSGRIVRAVYGAAFNRCAVRRRLEYDNINGQAPCEQPTNQAAQRYEYGTGVLLDRLQYMNDAHSHL